MKPLPTGSGSSLFVLWRAAGGLGSEMAGSFWWLGVACLIFPKTLAGGWLLQPASREYRNDWLVWRRGGKTRKGKQRKALKGAFIVGSWLTQWLACGLAGVRNLAEAASC